MTGALLLRCVVAIGLAALLSGLLCSSLGRWGWLDLPNQRSSHRRATPRGGGVAFVLAALLLAPGPVPLLLVPLPLALVGLLDDRCDLPVALRLPVQLLTGLVLALLCGWPLALASLVAVGAVAVINAVNFMDGLDGLVASVLVIWLGLAAVLLQQPALLLLAAALVGFLAWNWSPARLFMGDVGSTYLGAVMAGCLLLASTPAQRSALPALLLTALPLLGDAGWCLWRRWRAGQPLWQAHRLHLYQRLQQAGWSHGRVAGLYAGLSLAWALLALAVRTAPWPSQLAGVGAAAALTVVVAWQLDRRCAVPFR